MDLFLDLDSRLFLQSPAYPAQLHRLDLKRGDIEAVNLHFVREGRITHAAAPGTGLEVVGAGLESINGTYLRGPMANGRLTYTKGPHTFVWVPAGERMTGRMVVADCGTPELNGIYTRLGTANTKPRYRLGHVFLQWVWEAPSPDDPLTTIPSHWSLHDRAYYAESPSTLPGSFFEQSWRVGTGPAPAPKVTPELEFRPGHWGVTLREDSRRKAYVSFDDTAHPHGAANWTPRAAASPAPQVFPDREPLSGIAGLKLQNAYGSDFLTVATTWTPRHDPPGFRFLLPLDTPAIHDAFCSRNLAQISTVLEVEWRTGGLVSSSVALPVTIHNDFIRGDEPSLDVDTTPTA